MLYMCSVFCMIFVQFFGVIKCLNNPFCAICRIAHTKKPHRAIFKVTDSYLESGYLSKIYPYVGYIQNLTLWISSKDTTSPSWTCAFDLSTTTQILKPFARFNNTSQPYTDNVYPTDAVGLEISQGKNPFRPTNSTYEIIS